MPGESQVRPGIARLDGLLSLTFPPDPDADRLADDALRRLTEAAPVSLNVSREPGSITVLPEQDSFAFDPATRPSQVLLPAIRDLVEPLSTGPGCQVESTLRIQEFLGETVMEGVFFNEEGVGVVLKARERPMRPEERPVVPEPTITLRAESLLRRFQWPALILAAAIAVLVWVGWQSGWFAFGAGGGDGLEVDAGPLEGVVLVTKVKHVRRRLLVDLRPGPDFERFSEVAEGCSLKPGIFRVLLKKEDEQATAIVPLDLSDLPDRAADLEAGESIRYEVPYAGPSFDTLTICR
ncbi:MAG: hypothetical protein ACYTDY_02385 [Planctomycetota bacterium]|jgi:hypothetical protein